MMIKRSLFIAFLILFSSSIEAQVGVFGDDPVIEDLPVDTNLIQLSGVIVSEETLTLVRLNPGSETEN